jgi:hypothetical protein
MAQVHEIKEELLKEFNLIKEAKHVTNLASTKRKLLKTEAETQSRPKCYLLQIQPRKLSKLWSAVRRCLPFTIGRD